MIMKMRLSRNNPNSDVISRILSICLFFLLWGMEIQSFQSTPNFAVRYGSRLSNMRLENNSDGIEIEVLSPEKAAEMGIREWPALGQKSGVWRENVSKGTVRYILDGKGSVAVVDVNSASSAQKVNPGCLINVMEDGELEWKSFSDDMTILSPSFEDGPLLAAVAGILIIFCAVLIGNS